MGTEEGESGMMNTSELVGTWYHFLRSSRTPFSGGILIVSLVFYYLQSPVEELQAVRPSKATRTSLTPSPDASLQCSRTYRGAKATNARTGETECVAEETYFVVGGWRYGCFGHWESKC